MYDKIRAQLGQKYAGVPKNVLDQVAKRIAAKVTDEAGIEGAITEFDTVVGIQEFANVIQSIGDQRVTDAEKKLKGQAKPNNQEPAPGGSDTATSTSDSDKRIDALSTQIQQLQQQLSQQKQGSVTEQLHRKLQDEKIPLSFIKGRAIDPEKSVDEQFDSIKGDYTAFQQEMTDAGFSQTTPPGGGGKGKANDPSAAALDAAIAGWAGKGKAPVAAGAAK